MSINRVSISGNLTKDAEMRQTAGGLPILSISVAVNDRRKDSEGNWKDFPNFVDCVLFGKRAEAVAQYLTKGSKVAIDGKLRWSSWEKDGQKRSKLEVIIEELEFMTKAKSEAPGASDAPEYEDIPF